MRRPRPPDHQEKCEEVLGTQEWQLARAVIDGFGEQALHTRSLPWATANCARSVEQAFTDNAFS